RFMLTTRRVGAPDYGQTKGSRHTPLCRPPAYDWNLFEYGGRHMECAYYYETSAMRPRLVPWVPFT
ncbi:MAG: hypothetical protein ACKOAH_13635, partial [Pirellula sp.]